MKCQQLFKNTECGVQKMMIWKWCRKLINWLTWYCAHVTSSKNFLFDWRTNIEMGQEGEGRRSSNHLLSGTGLSDHQILERGEGWELAWQTFQQIHRIFWFWEWLHPFVKSSYSVKGGGWDCAQQTFQIEHLKDFKPNLRFCKWGVGWEILTENDHSNYVWTGCTHRQTLRVEYAISIGAGSPNCKYSIEMFSGSSKTYFRRRICTTGDVSQIFKCSIEILSRSNETNLRRRICTTHIGGGSPIAITVGNSWQADSVTYTLPGLWLQYSTTGSLGVLQALTSSPLGLLIMSFVE